MINAKGRECSSWYGIADRARALWREKVALNTELEETGMKITMVRPFIHLVISIAFFYSRVGWPVLCAEMSNEFQKSLLRSSLLPALWSQDHRQHRPVWSDERPFWMRFALRRGKGAKRRWPNCKWKARFSNNKFANNQTPLDPLHEENASAQLE